MKKILIAAGCLLLVVGCSYAWRITPELQKELEQKFFDCARMYAPAHDWSAALQAILALRTGGRVTALVKALTVVE